MFPRIILLSALATLPFSTTSVSASIPSRLPETRAVYQNLQRLKLECDRSITMTRQLRTAVASVRKGVDQSIDVTQAIRAMDRRLVKLIDQLKPYHSIPKVRTATRTLSKNLTRIQERLHKLRKKTDRCETEVLRPSRDRLKSLEASLRGAESKLREISTTASYWMANMTQAARAADQMQITRQALEANSRAARHVTYAAVKAVRSVTSAADSVGYKLNTVNQYFSSFRTVGRSLDEMSDKMKKGEELAGNLDKALGKRLTIKIPFTKKTLTCTVRDILEKPGQIMNIVLKPLEKLADAALQPVLRKLKLEIKPPKGLAELESKLTSFSSAGRNLQNSVSDLDRHLKSGLTAELQKLRAQMNTPQEIVRRAQLQARQAERPAPQPERRPIVSPVDPPAKEKVRTQPVFFLIAE